MTTNTELFKNVENNFLHHININENYRILMSGRFGIGKTTFLKHFFDSRKDQYNVLHLFPVNYSIIGNEDIFSYLKYDILVELFKNQDYPLKEDYYSFLKSWDDFLLDNLSQVIATTMLLIPKVGKQLHQFVNEITQLKKAFNKYKRTDKEIEKDKISQYLLKFHQAEGGIYETNVITLIIQEWLRDIKAHKKNILIIDDLDRIDPSHIFRLLNVFSAHFDSRDQNPSKNKFGFSKIILVCDIDNIQNIYKQQFGINTDFNGYIDKFYSLEVFRFDNKENLVSIIDNIINTISVSYYQNGTIVSHPSSKQIIDVLLVLLKPLVLSSQVNLRSIFKLSNKVLLLPKTKELIGDKTIHIFENHLLAAKYILTTIIGDFKVLQNKLSKLKTLKIEPGGNFKSVIGNMILFKEMRNLDYLYHYKGTRSNEIRYSFKINDKIYSGEFLVFGAKENNPTITGFASSLNINEEKILHTGQSLESIEIIDFIKDMFQIKNNE